MEYLPDNSNSNFPLLPNSSVAVLFFTRNEEEEASCKKFIKSGGPRKNRMIARLIIRHTRNLLKSLSVPVITVTPVQQKGDTFAEKFLSACERVFEMGFDNVLAVGNDCPSLTRSILETGISSLRNGNPVLGPASDGGAYLIGFKRQSFDRDRLLDLPWQTNRLFSGLRAHLTGGQRSIGETVLILSELSDADHESDLRSTLDLLFSRHLHFDFALSLKKLLDPDSVSITLLPRPDPIPQRCLEFLRSPPSHI